MKKFVLFMVAWVVGATGTFAATEHSGSTTAHVRNSNSFIFMENGVTFSVYPDGEFDFYIDNQVNVSIGSARGNVGVTFNSGFDYNPFVQYDDFGAVIQVENVPIFYDHYGRVSQIGNVDVWYRNGFVNRLGGLHVFWNRGSLIRTTGFINAYNRVYVYRPFHRWFHRPAARFCNVWTTPYRRFYSPVRYTWYSPYRNNIRRSYAQIGREYRYNNSPRRANIYRNDRRVAVRSNAVTRRNIRSNSNIATRNNLRTPAGRTVVNRSVGRTNTVTRSVPNTTVRTRSVGRTTVNRSVARTSSTRSTSNRSGRTVAQGSSSVTRKGTGSSRSVTQRTSTSSRRNVSTRSATSRSSASRRSTR